MGREIKPKRIGQWPYPREDGKSRISNFNEIQVGFSEEDAVNEANRCILCPIPACVRACPVNTDVLGMMKNIQERNYEEAYNVIRETNCLPGSSARVCPQLGNLCEGNCVIGKLGEPLSIGMLQRFVSDLTFIHGKYKEVEIAKSTGKRIAIIGGGPTGLAAAELLIQYGHSVTIFDLHDKLGGTAMFGIPNYHLSKKYLDSEIDRLVKMGIKLQKNIKVGSQISFKDIFDKGFDAILVASGAKKVTPFNVEGGDLHGVIDAYNFLITLDEMEYYKHPEKILPFKIGKKVLVVGGGDTAIDAARTSIRLGAKKVTMMYRRTEKEMTAYTQGRMMAREEGIKIEFLQVPIRLIGDKESWVKGAECIKMKLGEPDESGRAKPIPIKRSNFILDVDTVFIAIGRGPNTFLQEKFKMKMEHWGGIIVDQDTYETSYPGVFAAGDVVTGESLVIKAMGEGRRAAQRVHEYLSSSTECLDLTQKYFHSRYGRKNV